MALFEDTDVADCLTRVLSTVSVAASAMPAELPDRQFISAGGVVYDCALVSASVMTVQMGLPEEVNPAGVSTYPPGMLSSIWSLAVEVSIARVAQERPDGRNGDKPPRVEWIADDARAVSRDIAILINAAELLGAHWNTALPHPIQVSQTQGGIVAVVASMVVPLWPM